MEFVHFPCPQALNHWLHCTERNEYPGQAAEQVSLSCCWKEGGKWLSSRDAHGRLLALKQWTSSLLQQPPHSPSSNPESPISLAASWQRWIKLGEYTMYAIQNAEITQLWDFCLVLPCSYMGLWFYMEFLFVFNSCWHALYLVPEWSA